MDNRLEADQQRTLAQYRGARQQRSFRFMPGGMDEAARTVEVAFSSEEPFERIFGEEILSHDRDAIVSTRLDDGIAVLVNHNTDQQVGVTAGWSIGTDRRGRAVLRFGASALAEEIFQDVKAGIRRLVSVGYIVHDMVLKEEREGALPSYLVTRWEPIEISIVPVPADATVGVGRALEDLPAAPASTERKRTMENDTTVQVDIKQAEQGAEKRAQDRVNEIVAIGEQHGLQELAREALVKGTSAADFRAEALVAIGKARKVTVTPEIGMTEREIQQFSWIRALNALAFPGDRQAQEAAAFEREASAAAQQRTGKVAKGIMVPHDVLTQQRAMVVGTNADGGYLKGTDQRGDQFINRLFNAMMVQQMGAKMLPGLVGDVAIPKMSAGHTAYWVDESTDVTESKPTLGQVLLQPKQVGALSDISRKLLLQASPAVDALVKDDLALTLALALDLAALHGTGADNQPTGIEKVSGIGSVAGGTHGAAPTLAHVIQLETEVAQDNAAIGSLGYLTNAKVRGKLRGTFPNSTGGDNAIWQNGPDGWGSILGYKAGVSNQVSSTLTKGNSSGVCSAIIFGNWADLLVGMWGGLDLTVDPYSLSAKGWLRVVAIQSVDIGVRNAQSFAAMLDALTT